MIKTISYLLIIWLLISCQAFSGKSVRKSDNNFSDALSIYNNFQACNDRLANDLMLSKANAKGYGYLMSEEYSLAIPLLKQSGNFYGLTYAYSEVNMDSAKVYFDKYCKTLDLTEDSNLESLMTIFSFISQYDSIINYNIKYHKIKKNTPPINLEYRLLLSELIDQDQNARKPYNVKKMKYVDSINRHKLDSLFAIYGWPGTNVIGKYRLNNKSVFPSLLVIHQDLGFNLKYLNAALTSFSDSLDDFNNSTTILKNFFYRFNDVNGYNYLPFFKFIDDSLDFKISEFQFIVLKTFIESQEHQFEIIVSPEVAASSFLFLENYFDPQTAVNVRVIRASEPFNKRNIPTEYQGLPCYIALKQIDSYK